MPGRKPASSAVRSSLPTVQPLQLCTLVEHAPEGGDWVSEIKFDGYRLLAHSDDVSHRFRPNPATYSDRSQPGIPRIPAA